MSALDNWSIENTFPPLAGKKIVIVYSPDLESDLISSIAVDLYGVDNVIWICGNTTEASNHNNLKYNFIENVTTKFNGKHTIFVPRERLKDVVGYNAYLDRAKQILLEYSSSLTINNIHALCGFTKGNVAIENALVESFNNYAGDVWRYIENNLDQIEIFREYFGVDSTQDNIIVNRLQLLREVSTNSVSYSFITNPPRQHGDNNVLVYPFATLTFSEVAQLAINLNKETVLLNSWNCTDTLYKLQPRCGTCGSCLQFKRALRDVGKLEDVEFAE